MAGGGADADVTGGVVLAVSGSGESQQVRCLSMSGQESEVMEGMLSVFLLESGPAIDFRVVDMHLCWTCRAF